MPMSRIGVRLSELLVQQICKSLERFFVRRPPPPLFELKLTTAFQIPPPRCFELRRDARVEDADTYFFVQRERASGDVLEFGEGCIYPILHRLEKDGHLGSSRETVGGRSRVVYRILPSGRKRWTRRS